MTHVRARLTVAHPILEPRIGAKHRKPSISGTTDVLASVPWVAQWKFNNNGNDSIGATHLTNNNSCTFVSGLLGGATGATRLVAASSQYWSHDAPGFDYSGDFTFAFHFMFRDPFGSGSTFFQQFRTGGFDKVSFHYDASGFWGGPATEDTFMINNYSVGPVFVPDFDVWYHLILTYEAATNTYSLYKDGTLFGTSGQTISADNPTFLRIGSGAIPANGQYDNFVLATSASGAGGVLNSAQRAALYNAGAGTEDIT